MQNTNTIIPDGVLLINKHAGVTSHDIVGKVRRLYGTRAVGHAGTLDPMATGVLVVLLGRAAKASEYLGGEGKRYAARLRLGLTTDTEDITGAVLTHTDDLPTSDAVLSVIPRFIGTIKQVPPMYSALKRDGQKLVDLARQGITIEREAREITVSALTCTPTDDPAEYELDVRCSGGTYIRTLCADIGASLGCGGVMSALCRTEACGFSIDQAHTTDALEGMTPQERESLLIPIEALFSSLPSVRLSPFFEKLCRSGCEIYQKKIGVSLPLGTRVRICDESGEFFALGEVKEFDNGMAIKAIKTFALD
jgi:tRNA pseudouridine55 synthase